MDGQTNVEVEIVIWISDIIFEKIIPDFKMDLPKEIIDTMLQMALEIVPIIASVLSMPLN